LDELVGLFLQLDIAAIGEKKLYVHTNVSPRVQSAHIISSSKVYGWVFVMAGDVRSRTCKGFMGTVELVLAGTTVKLF